MEKLKLERKNKCKNLFISTAIMIGTFLCNSCVSNKNVILEKKTDLQVYIIDENNNPISDFVVCYSKDPKGFKSDAIYTNEKGFCKFENVPYGKLFLFGTKESYKILDGVSINFSKPTDVFFCVAESKVEILERVEKFYKSGRFEEGLDLLQKIKVEKGSYLEGTILFYECYGFACSGKTSERDKKLRELKKNKNEGFLELAKELEEKLKI